MAFRAGVKTDLPPEQPVPYDPRKGALKALRAGALVAAAAFVLVPEFAPWFLAQVPGDYRAYAAVALAALGAWLRNAMKPRTA